MATLPIGPHRIEEMLKACLEQAKAMLEKNGAFFPFGAAIDSEGNRHPVTGNAGEGAKTPAVYDVIKNGLRAQFFKGEILAGAIVAEVTIPSELKPSFPGGLRIAVESASIARLVFLPFRKIKKETLSDPAADQTTASSQPAFEFGELIGVNLQPSLFARTANEKS